MNTLSSNQRIPSLDGLRAISILLVLIGHLSLRFPRLTPICDPVLTVLGNSSLGVSIFFVISGFLITWLLLVEIEKKGQINLKAFYLRRLFRIVPAYFVFLGAVLVLCKIGIISIPMVQLASAFLFILNYAIIVPVWWLGHTWSLCVEEQFYLLMASTASNPQERACKIVRPVFNCWSALDPRSNIFPFTGISRSYRKYASHTCRHANVWMLACSSV
jgi:peptidoglycan/LPS O-acetylase OafA/YrhL